MYLTISKRFEFCASHRCFVLSWPPEKNSAIYGDQAKGNFGHGHNYQAHFVFQGPVGSKTGLMINFDAIKQTLAPLLEERFDHKYLNSDTPPFDRIVPTLENLSRQLLAEAADLFSGQAVQPVACHVIESPESSATAFVNGRIERDFWLEFSAARRTYSPNLSEEENFKIFGQAASLSGHGHNYRVRVTIGGELDRENGLLLPLPMAAKAISELHSELDHKNLNVDVPGLESLPMTTETLARYIWHRLEKKLSLQRVRLYEKSDFFVECHGHDLFFMGIENKFQAAHRLHTRQLSEQENKDVYGKCNNPNGHGHQYRVECSIGGKLDEKSGTLFNLVELNQILASTLGEWDYKHLELEAEDFREKPSTGENIIQVLWSKLERKLGEKLHRLRIWETPNNRITLRRSI
jgi:6-pyruvoyltetrahydropterin/6-carboxytetrahydropterin synthase